MTQKVTLQGNPITVEGDFPQAGSMIKDFTLATKDLEDVSLVKYAGQYKILNIFPSIDTGVCATSVRQFNEKASALSNSVVLCISADLPFAQARFCGSEGLTNVIMLSSFRSPQFALNYGVAITSGPLMGLLSRAVIVLDQNNKVIYSQLVPEIAEEPNYDAALNILK